MSSESMTIHLEVWRQEGPNEPGHMMSHTQEGVTPDMSFLEMLDLVNEELIAQDKEPIAFDSDCREGICGTCGFVINGQAHGPQRSTSVCQLHMRSFDDGDTLVLEPFRAEAFPVVKDLVIDRSAFDRIMEVGGYVSVGTGPKPDANTIKVGKDTSDEAFLSATCIGCGACVAACPNASASLFTSAKISQFALMPQGDPERGRRAVRMVHQMDEEGFGNCSNIGECSATCPKDIKLENIARMRREYAKAMFQSTGEAE